MKELKPSHLLAAVAWAFTFMVGANIVMRKIPADLLSWGMFLLFFLVAVMASAVAQGKPRIKDLRVYLSGQLYTQESGAVEVYQSPKGTTVVNVYLAKTNAGTTQADPRPESPPIEENLVTPKKIKK